MTAVEAGPEIRVVLARMKNGSIRLISQPMTQETARRISTWSGGFSLSDFKFDSDDPLLAETLDALRSELCTGEHPR